MKPGSDKARQHRRLVLRDHLRNIPEPHGNSHLMQLPPEILLLIADYLPDEAKGALALTCKMLWWRWESTFRNKDTWALVLGLVERDIPGVFFCYECGRLEPLKRQRRSKYHRPLRSPEPHLNLDAKTTLSRLITPWVWPEYMRLNFYHAHLVMNAHRYGARHGMPLETLRREKKGFYRPSRWSGFRTLPVATRTSWEPRIIDGELFVRRTLTMGELIPRAGRALQLRDGRKHNINILCPDGRTSDCRRSFCQVDGFTWVGIHYCQPTQPTEIGLRVEEGSSKCNMVVRVYYELGKCERPDDWKWSRHVPGHFFSPNDPYLDPMLKWKRATGDYVGPIPKGLEDCMDGVGIRRDDHE